MRGDPFFFGIMPVSSFVDACCLVRWREAMTRRVTLFLNICTTLDDGQLTGYTVIGQDDISLGWGLSAQWVWP